MVLLGFDLPEARCDGLLGFAIHRVDHTEDEAGYLTGMKCLRRPTLDSSRGRTSTTRDHPIQSLPMGGLLGEAGTRVHVHRQRAPGHPVEAGRCRVGRRGRGHREPQRVATTTCTSTTVSTASQEYARRFGNRQPEQVPNHATFDWLSRGLYEAMADFVTSTTPGVKALRIAAYEFNHPPFLELLKEQPVDAGVDVQSCTTPGRTSPASETPNR